MTGVFFVYAFLGTGGNVVFDLGSATILGIAVLVSGVSILGFLRQAIRHMGLGILEKTGAVVASASTGQTVQSTLPEPSVETVSRATQPEGGRTVASLPFRLPNRRQDEWEEASEKEEDEEGG